MLNGTSSASVCGSCLLFVALCFVMLRFLWRLLLGELYEPTSPASHSTVKLRNVQFKK